jgi:hypothetical protein
MTTSPSPKKPMAKMPLRVGTCRIYFIDEDVTCPFCETHVPAGRLHECVQPPAKGRTESEVSE